MEEFVALNKKSLLETEYGKTSMTKFNVWLTQEEILKKNPDLNDPELKGTPIIAWCPEWRKVKDGETGETVIDPETGKPKWKYRLLPFERYSGHIINHGALLYTLRYDEDITKLEGLIDGLLIPGGSDVDPKRYGEENLASQVEYDHSDLRWESTARLYNHAPKDMPVLAICYGYEFLNVALGGSLIQDLENKNEHVLKIKRLKVIPGTHLSKALKGKEEMLCFCAHHQNVKKIADGLIVNCEDNLDGSVHGLELPEDSGRKVFSVLFHPEEPVGKMVENDEHQDDGDLIFGYFVNLAKEYRESRQNLSS